jgi:hypothetical protein
MATLIVVWLFCGFVAAAVAARKKLKVVAWVLMGALFGPVALMLVAFQAGPNPSVWSSGGSDKTFVDGGGCGGGCC